MPRTDPLCPPEFRAEAVRLVREGGRGPDKLARPNSRKHTLIGHSSGVEKCLPRRTMIQLVEKGRRQAVRASQVRSVRTGDCGHEGGGTSQEASLRPVAPPPARLRQPPFEILPRRDQQRFHIHVVEAA